MIKNIEKIQKWDLGVCLSLTSGVAKAPPDKTRHITLTGNLSIRFSIASSFCLLGESGKQ